MNKKIILGLSLALLYSASVQAMEFKHGPWTINAGVNATVLYGYNKYQKKYDVQNNRDETYSSVYVTLSAAYNFNDDYQLALYYLPNSSGTSYLKNYEGHEWINQAYGALQTPYGQIQAGPNYNVAYQFYVGAPVLAPLYVNNSAITDFLDNPNWDRDGGPTAFYPTLDSTQLDSDNIANKFTYISPTVYGTNFGFSYMPQAYNNQGMISGYAPYRNEEAYVFALSNEYNLGEVTISSYAGYGIYVNSNEDLGLGMSVSYKGWNIGGSYRQTNVTGDDDPLNIQIDPTLTPDFYDGYREGYAWNIGASYTYEKWTTALTYFEAKADRTKNRDQYVQFLNQYALNDHLTLYAALAHVRFRGMTNTPADSNKGYSLIGGFSISI